MHQLGTDCKLYLDPAGLTGTPTWTEYTDIEDNNLNDARNAEEVMNRGSDWVQVLAGKRNASIEFTATWDEADAQYQDLLDAYNTKAEIGVAVMSGDIIGSGSEGVQAGCQVVQFNRQEPLQGAVKVAVVLRPYAGATIGPSFVQIP